MKELQEHKGTLAVTESLCLGIKAPGLCQGRIIDITILTSFLTDTHSGLQLKSASYED